VIAGAWYPNRELERMHSSTVVIGAGRVGQTVAARLGAQLIGRDGEPDLSGCRRLLIATPDAAIRPVCEALAPRLDAGAAVIHFSGATSIHALDAADGPTACVHPLQTVWPEFGPDQLEGAYAAVTGDREVGDGLARELGMTPFSLADEAKPIYHAASAFASNYLVTLTQVAIGLMEHAGIDRDLARRALRPLQERTLEVADRPPTGPIARGDADTVAAHMEAIGAELAPLYAALGRATLPIVPPASAAAVEHLL
jgi:predicted short-subunit dehydrogenase-like oxidoreductase (DUF2520 family)